MDYWKSVRETIEIVDSTLPDPDAHTVRRTEVHGVHTVFVPYHRDGRPYLGSAAVEFEAGEPSPGALSAARRRALEVPDSWYPLELAPTLPLPARTSTLEKQDLARWIEPFDEVISKTLGGEPVLPLREHLRFCRHAVHYRDSFGRELAEYRYTGSLEVLLTPREAPQAHPYTAEIGFSEFSPEVIAGFLREQARLSCEAHQAEMHAPEGDHLILVRGAPLAAFFDYLLGQLGAPAAAAGESDLRVGAPLWDRDAVEPLGLTALAELYNSPKPGGFDGEGLVLPTHTLLQDGTVQGLWSTQATAHWLGVPLTGRPRNFSVSPGSLSWAGLAGQKVLEVHRLRWLQVEPNGDFSAEVGLADWHEGSRRTPVFGFTLRGNLREVLTKARFSSDVGTWEHFEGPEFLVVPSTVVRSM